MPTTIYKEQFKIALWIAGSSRQFEVMQIGQYSQRHELRFMTTQTPTIFAVFCKFPNKRLQFSAMGQFNYLLGAIQAAAAAAAASEAANTDGCSVALRDWASRADWRPLQRGASENFD